MCWLHPGRQAGRLVLWFLRLQFHCAVACSCGITVVIFLLTRESVLLVLKPIFFPSSQSDAVCNPLTEVLSSLLPRRQCRKGERECPLGRFCIPVTSQVFLSLGRSSCGFWAEFKNEIGSTSHSPGSQRPHEDNKPEIMGIFLLGKMELASFAQTRSFLT